MRRALLLFGTLTALSSACGRVLDDEASAPLADAASPSDAGATTSEAAAPDAGDPSAPDRDAGFAVPFAMTFEQTLFGPDGANEPTSARRATRPIFGLGSAEVPSNLTTTITRRFPPQDSLYVSFYVRFGTAGGRTVFARLIGSGATLVELEARPGEPGLSYVVSAHFTSGAGQTFTLGNLGAGGIYRFGFKSVLIPGTGPALEVFLGTGSLTAEAYGQASLDQGTPIAIEVGNLGAGSQGLALVFDDVLGERDGFAPPSE
ncbi:MAG: hypothetical protein KF764_02160 [Labilithrix sp.]|nr:hypothetical protein [Labilithrix sp.]